MIPHQGDVLTQSTFTFSTNSSSRNSNRHLSNELEFNRWAEKINKTSYNLFGRSTDSKVGPWSSHNRPRRYYFNTSHGVQEDGSDVASPTLWQPAVEYPVSSRSRSIAKYRQAMLDLVKDVPENGYELSLKDIVELPRVSTQLQQQGLQSPSGGASTPIHEEVGDDDDDKGKKKNKKNGKKRAKKVSATESLVGAGGFLLKLFVPPGWGRRQSFSRNGGGMVSTKPAIADGAERDWWKRNELSESSGSSSRGSRSSSTRRKASGCLPFLNSHKNKATDF